MRIIRGRPHSRSLLKEMALVTATGDAIDTSQGEFDKLVRSKSPDGKFLRSLLSPKKQPTNKRRKTR